MLEDAEHLLIQRIFGYAIVVIEPCLGSPTDVERRGHIVACPIEDLGHLVPIAHLLEVEVLDRCTGDDEAVVLMVAHLLEIGVEGLHMLYGRILRGVALDLHEAQLNLQRRVGEQAHEVCLGRYLERHEVEHSDTQRTNILRRSTRAVHHEDILLFQ